MIIEFRVLSGCGADIDWISKYEDEREVLLAPWFIAAPDCSREHALSYAAG